MDEVTDALLRLLASTPLRSLLINEVDVALDMAGLSDLSRDELDRALEEIRGGLPPELAAELPTPDDGPVADAVVDLAETTAVHRVVEIQAARAAAAPSPPDVAEDPSAEISPEEADEPPPPPVDGVDDAPPPVDGQEGTPPPVDGDQAPPPPPPPPPPVDDGGDVGEEPPPVDEGEGEDAVPPPEDGDQAEPPVDEGDGEPPPPPVDEGQDVEPPPVDEGEDPEQPPGEEGEDQEPPAPPVDEGEDPEQPPGEEGEDQEPPAPPVDEDEDPEQPPGEEGEDQEPPAPPVDEGEDPEQPPGEEGEDQEPPAPPVDEEENGEPPPGPAENGGPYDPGDQPIAMLVNGEGEPISPVYGHNADGHPLGPDGQPYFHFNGRWYDADGDRITDLTERNGYFADGAGQGSLILPPDEDHEGWHWPDGSPYEHLDAAGNPIVVDADGDPVAIDPTSGLAYRVDANGWPLDHEGQAWPDGDGDGVPEAPSGWAPEEPAVEVESPFDPDGLGRLFDDDGDWPISYGYGEDDEGRTLDENGDPYYESYAQESAVDPLGNRIYRGSVEGRTGWEIHGPDGEPLVRHLDGSWTTASGDPYQTDALGNPVAVDSSGEVMAVDPATGWAYRVDAEGWPLDHDGEPWPDVDGDKVPERPPEYQHDWGEPIDLETLPHLVDADGNPITIAHRVDEDGNPVDPWGNPYPVDDDGNPIDTNGNPRVRGTTAGGPGRRSRRGPPQRPLVPHRRGRPAVAPGRRRQPLAGRPERGPSHGRRQRPPRGVPALDHGQRALWPGARRRVRPNLHDGRPG